MLYGRTKQNEDSARRCRLRGVVLFLLVSLWTASEVSAQSRFPINCNDPRSNQQVNCRVRDCDQVFLVSSREMFNRNCPTESLKVWRACGEDWVQTDIEHLLNSEFCEAKRKTVMFVHGHMTNFEYAQIRGFQTYQTLFTEQAAAPPTRFVIWAWPSEVRGDRRYTAGKSYKKADLHSFFLARLLFRFEQGTPVSLLGYSYGARMVLGALHLGGGGKIDGFGIGECSTCRLSPYTTTLIAPGIEHDCLEPCGSRSQALKLIDNLLVIHNRCDPALKAYRLALRTGFKRVLGLTGLLRATSVENGGLELTQIDASKLIGPRHALSNYITCNRIEAEIRKHVFNNQ